MDAEVKKLAKRVLTHSQKDIALMHTVMQSEAGNAYTEDDRRQLEEIVKRAHKMVLRDVDAL